MHKLYSEMVVGGCLRSKESDRVKWPIGCPGKRRPATTCGYIVLACQKDGTAFERSCARIISEGLYLHQKDKKTRQKQL